MKMLRIIVLIIAVSAAIAPCVAQIISGGIINTRRPMHGIYLTGQEGMYISGERGRVLAP